MGSHTFIAYGYGFPVDSLIPNKFIAFINNHKTALDVILQNESSETSLHDMRALIDFCENATPDDLAKIEYLDEIADDYDRIEDIWGNQHMLGILSRIISHETKVNMEFQRGDNECESNPSLILAKGMPWDFNNTEQTFTSEDELKSILSPYAIELGVNTDLISDLEIEYWI